MTISKRSVFKAAVVVALGCAAVAWSDPGPSQVEHVVKPKEAPDDGRDIFADMTPAFSRLWAQAGTEVTSPTMVLTPPEFSDVARDGSFYVVGVGDDSSYTNAVTQMTVTLPTTVPLGWRPTIRYSVLKPLNAKWTMIVVTRTSAPKWPPKIGPSVAEKK